ncbi:peptidase S41 [Bacteroidia bacterium]|nr:peptidase S41 [Bacteroidia bacterium]
MIWWFICAITVSLIIGIIAGNFISGKSFGRKLFLNSAGKVNVILDIINEDYVDAVNMHDITEGAIRNIINELDPHSAYISTSELQGINEDMDGHFGGIGIDYFVHEDTMVVANVFYGSPSSQAGILPGDRIIRINDSICTGMDITQEMVSKKLRGKVGSTMKLTVQRNFSPELINYKIKRDNILMTTVKAAYQVEEGIGLIKIYDKFSQTTYNEFMQAISQLKAQGCSSYILDLRGNGGGSYEAAVQIINEFLPEGRKIVTTEGKSFPQTESIADGRGSFQNNPLVILIDQLSASASEIIAGAIQDNDRGLIIGRTSFGKGLVQNQIELSDGSAIRLTIARYYTPSGRNIQRKYELGKSDLYNQEWINRLTHGENFESNMPDETAAFQTLHGRTVYGNGGITPDIFVPMNDAQLTSYYIHLDEKGIFRQFTLEYIDQNRAFLNTLKDNAAMLDYLKKQPLLREIVQFSEENGIRKRTALISRSANQILLTTYACILGNFFGENDFYEIYLSNDPDIARAVKMIRGGETTPKK